MPYTVLTIHCSAMHNDQNTEEVKFAAAEKLGELQK